MLDHEICTALRAVLGPLVKEQFPTTEIIQAFQGTSQGVPTDPTVFIHKISDKRYGFPRTDHQFRPAPGTDPLDPNIPTVTTQLVESRFQFSALRKNNPSDPAPVTASDMLRYVAMLMSVDGILHALRARGLKLMRILDVVNPYFTDDSDQFAASPTFDVVIQHYDTYSAPVPKIIAVVPEVHAV